MAVKIEKDTIIGDVLDIAPHAAPLFFAIGMHCLGCPSSRGETVEEACMVHGIDCEPFLAQLNHFLAAYEAAEAEKKQSLSGPRNCGRSGLLCRFHQALSAGSAPVQLRWCSGYSGRTLVRAIENQA